MRTLDSICEMQSTHEKLKLSNYRNTNINYAHRKIMNQTQLIGIYKKGWNLSAESTTVHGWPSDSFVAKSQHQTQASKIKQKTEKFKILLRYSVHIKKKQEKPAKLSV